MVHCIRTVQQRWRRMITCNSGSKRLGCTINKACLQMIMDLALKAPFVWTMSPAKSLPTCRPHPNLATLTSRWWTLGILQKTFETNPLVLVPMCDPIYRRQFRRFPHLISLFGITWQRPLLLKKSFKA